MTTTGISELRDRIFLVSTFEAQQMETGEILENILR